MDGARFRAQQNWRHMLKMSSDTGTLVQYEVTQLLNMLEGDSPLDSGVVNTVGLIWGLLDIVIGEKGAFPEGAKAGVKMLGGFMEFLVRCNNTRSTPLLLEVEAKVTSMVYSLACQLKQSPETHQQFSPFVPFLLHVSMTQLKQHKATGIEVFGTPPRWLHADDMLPPEDQYTWLSIACLNLIDTAYFPQLLRYSQSPEDRMLQVAFMYELLEQAVYCLNRSLEALYAVPLNMQPKARSGCAEPKVNPRKVLSFLVDEDTSLMPPGDYSSDANQEWAFDREAAEIHCETLLKRMTVLKGLLPLSPTLCSVDRHIGAMVLKQQLRFICGTLHWILTTLMSSIHNMAGLHDNTLLIPLWEVTVPCLMESISDFGVSDHSDEVMSQLVMLQLLRACLHVIAIDEAFLSYHPQGALEVLKLKFASEAEGLLDVAPSARPLLHLLSIAHNPVLYSAFTGGKRESVMAGSRPPLEMCIASFLHSLFTMHLEIAKWCINDDAKRAAVAVPIQNIFRGMHASLASMTTAEMWKEVFTPFTVGGEAPSLGPNWLKATEIAKAFAVLPFGESVQQVDTVSQNAWTLVHYYFQLSIPCAPTAPPCEVSLITPGQGWDDYEEYFRDLESAQANRMRDPSEVTFPTDFGLSDNPGDLGYRLHQLLSSHLRGILTIMPYFHILFVANKRECLLEQCAYYCSSVADLIGFSAHNHGVAVPFLRASLDCFEAIESPQALAAVDKLEKIFLTLMDLPSASLAQSHGKRLASMFSDSPRMSKKKSPTRH